MEENKIVDTAENKEVTSDGNKPDSADTQADLEAKYQALLVEQKRLKSAFDKASSDAANYKKQLRERQSVDEIAIQEKAEQEAMLAGIRGEVKDNGWGSQIRSYVLQPYRMVKDLRSGEETGNTDSVLDGDIDRFITAYLKWIQLGCPDRKVAGGD